MSSGPSLVFCKSRQHWNFDEIPCRWSRRQQSGEEYFICGLQFLPSCSKVSKNYKYFAIHVVLVSPFRQLISCNRLWMKLAARRTTFILKHVGWLSVISCKYSRKKFEISALTVCWWQFCFPSFLLTKIDSYDIRSCVEFYFCGLSLLSTGLCVEVVDIRLLP